jgi:arginine deiminase
MEYGCQSETGQIKSILLKSPKDAFLDQHYIDSNWKDLNYTGCPDFDKVVDEFEYFVELIKAQTTHIHYLPADHRTGLDSIYTHDPMLMTQNGAVLCNMGKTQRTNEPAAMGQYLEKLDIPILGSITGSGRLECGDVAWLTDSMAAVGLTYRTNAEGVDQFKALTRDIVEEVIMVPLPHWNGEMDCFHLMSIISPVDDNLAVVYSRLMPVPFRQRLISLGIELIEVPDNEFVSMGCNVLAVAPRKCIVVAGNPMTKKRLERCGAEVFEFKAEDLCLKGGGGPTCLTRPLLRK